MEFCSDLLLSQKTVDFALLDEKYIKNENKITLSTEENGK